MLDKFISEFCDDLNNGKSFNEDVIYKLREESIVPYIIDVYKLLECKYIKLLDYELITDESKFDTTQVIVSHIKNKNNKQYDKRMPIDQSRYDLLRAWFQISFKGEVIKKEVNLLLYKRINKYYYMINGNQYYPIYQLVDSSTYSNGENCITQKTIPSPLIMRRKSKTIVDIEGMEFTVPSYIIYLFKKVVQPITYYLGAMGLENTLTFMQMEDIISFVNINSVDETELDNEFYYFPVADSNIVIKVIRKFFDKDLFTQNMVCSFLTVMQGLKMYQIHDKILWIRILSSQFTTIKDLDKLYCKGKDMLFSFHRILDGTTQRNLKLKWFNKASTFAIVRWMMRNFSDLKNKDNMDLKNKRLRMAEYMAFYLARKLLVKMNAILSKKESDLTMDKLEELLDFNQNILCKALLDSKKSVPLIRYDNIVNDMNVFTALKFSIKGPGSIGENSKNSINKKHRDLHPSYLGRLDLNTCSSSDPGMTGIIVPYAKTYGHHFDIADEPQGWDDFFDDMYENYFGYAYEDKCLNFYYDKSNKMKKKSFVFKENTRHFILDDPYYQTGEMYTEPNTVNKVNIKFKIGDVDLLKKKKKKKRKSASKPKKDDKIKLKIKFK